MKDSFDWGPAVAFWATLFVAGIALFAFLAPSVGGAVPPGANENVSASNETNTTNSTPVVVDSSPSWYNEAVGGYAYHSNNTQYNFSIKQASNFGDGTRYCIGSQCLTYQLQDVSYRDSNGAQDYLSSLQYSEVVVENDTATYPSVFSDVNLTYTLSDLEVKEEFVLSALPRAPAAYLNNQTTLDFGGYIKYGSLSMLVDGESLGSDFVTGRRIDFVDESNETVFYLPAPVAVDANGESVSLEYEVEDRGSQIWFYVRTPYEWLSDENRSYPVYIDPTVSVPTFEGSTGLVAYYNFENEDTVSTTLYDAWGSNDGTIAGATTNVTGVLGEQYSFDGTNDYVQTTVSDTFTEVTISFWMDWDDYGTSNVDMVFEGSSAGLLMVHTGSTTNALRFGVDNSDYLDVANAILDGMNHYVFTYNSNGTTSFYRNGELVVSETKPSGKSATITYWGLGRRGTSSSVYFPGDLDEVALYNTALDADTISSLYNNGTGARPFSLKTDIRAYHAFENETTSGTTAYDHWNDNDATLTNSPATGAVGRIGDAYSFSDSDTNDYVQLNEDIYTTDISELTISAWVYLDTIASSPSLYDIVSAEDVSSGNGFTLRVDYNGGSPRVAFFHHSGGTNSRNSFTPSNSIGTGAWHHVVATYEPGDVKIYIDGVRQTLTTAGTIGTIIENPSNKIVIGNFADTGHPAFPRPIDGRIDEVILYDRALGGQEVFDLYTDQSNDVRPWSGYEYLANSVKNAWTFDDEDWSGTTVVDIAGSENLTAVGTFTNITGKAGESAVLDGSTNYFKSDTNDWFFDWSSGEERTYSFWVNETDVSGAVTYAGYYTGGGSTVSSWNGQANGSHQTQIRNGASAYQYTYTDAVRKVGWSHVVMTVDSSGNTEIWIDNVSRGTGSLPEVTTNVRNSYFMATHADVDYVDFPISFVEGSVDELYIYDRKLNQYQIQELYTATDGGEQYPFTVAASSTVDLTAVNVTVSDTNPYEGDNISYTTTITPGNATNVTYFVDFGDGSNSTDANSSHIYDSSGTYNLTVNATDSQSNTFTSTAVITVEDNPITNVFLRLNTSETPTIRYSDPTSDLLGEGWGGSYEDISDGVRQPSTAGGTDFITTNGANQVQWVTVPLNVSQDGAHIDNITVWVLLDNTPNGGDKDIRVDLLDNGTIVATETYPKGTSAVSWQSFTWDNIETFSNLTMKFTTIANPTNLGYQVYVYSAYLEASYGEYSISPFELDVDQSYDYEVVVDGGNSPYSYQLDWGDGESNDTTATGTQTYTADGDYNISLLVTDADGDTGTSSPVATVSSTVVEEPTITPNLTITRFADYVIRANVTNTTILHNVTLTYFAGAGFGEPCSDYYVNGTCNNETFENLEMTYNSTTGLWEYTVYPDSTYPEIIFTTSSETWLNPPQNSSISRNQYHVFNYTNNLTVTNQTAFFIELNVAPKSTTLSVPLDVYLINNSVTDASFFTTDWRSDPRAVLVESISRDTPPSHTHTDNSSHYVIRLSTDSNGLVQGLNVSDNFKIAFLADTTADNRGWWLRYQDSCNTTRWLTADSSPTWQALSIVPTGCPDTHVHMARISDDAQRDYVNATVTASYAGGSASNSTQFFFDPIPNVAPNPSSFITPASDGYVSRLLNATYNVSWNPATDIDNDVLLYTVTLRNPDLTLNTTIVTDTLNTSYDWTIPTSLDDGSYTLQLVVCDTLGLCTTNRENITLDSTNPVLSNIVLPSVNADDTGIFTLTVDEENVDNVTLTFNDPNGNIIGPLLMVAGGGDQYLSTYRFSVVGDYSNATFTATDLAGNTVTFDAGGFEITNAPTTGGGGGGGSGVTSESDSGTITQSEIDATMSAQPSELRLSAFSKGGELVVTNFETQQETFSIFVVETGIEDAISFSGEPAARVAVRGTGETADTSAVVEYTVDRTRLPDGEYEATFILVDSQGGVADFVTVSIIEKTTVTDTLMERLTGNVVPPIELGFARTPSLSYLSLGVILSSFLLAGLVVRSTLASRRRKKE